MNTFPLELPIEKINEKEGTIEFTISKGNLFDRGIE